MLFHKSIKIGELLRNRQNRHVYLVAFKYKEFIFVTDLMDRRENPALIYIILPAFYEYWDRDTEIEDLEKWEKDLLESKMPIVESVESLVHTKK